MGSDLTNKCWITNRKEIKSYNGALMPYKGDLDALHRLQTASWLSKHQSWPRTKSFQRFKTSSVINKTKERKAFKIVREQKRSVSCLTAPRVCGVWSPENFLPRGSTHSCRTFISIRTGKKKKNIYICSIFLLETLPKQIQKDLARINCKTLQWLVWHYSLAVAPEGDSNCFLHSFLRPTCRNLLRTRVEISAGI